MSVPLLPNTLPPVPTTLTPFQSAQADRNSAAQAAFDTLTTACRALIKDIDLVAKLSTRVIDAAEADLKAYKESDSNQPAPFHWDPRAVKRHQKDLDTHR